ncbi:MAG: hypothetical protein M3P82_04880, partial [Bacteroidota bacterium]|nr:hypothetical protein [Bacteroidota bacterium]
MKTFKTSKPARTSKPAKTNKATRSNKASGHVKENNSGEIDFGKDGRMVLRKTTQNGTGNTIGIKDAKTHKLKIGDKVEYKTVKSPDGKEIVAEITKVLTEGNKYVSGRFENHKSYGLVSPDSRDIKKEIIIAAEDFYNAADGDKVHVEILNPEAIRDELTDLRGRIIEVFGKSGEKGAEEKSIIRKYNLSTSFPREVEKEAESVSIDYDMKDRIDLRDKIIFTIDP